MLILKRQFSITPALQLPSMPTPPSTPPDDDVNPPDSPESDSEFPASMDIEQWIERLKQADRSLYNMMALEVWSIARTMDGLVPGFWNRFMENRQLALKQFVAQRKVKQASQDNAPAPKEDSPDTE